MRKSSRYKSPGDHQPRVPAPCGTFCTSPRFVHLHIGNLFFFPMPFKCQSPRYLSKIEIYQLNREAGLLSLLLGTWSLLKSNFHRRLPPVVVPRSRGQCSAHPRSSRSTRISSKFQVSSAFAKVEHNRSPALHLLVLARSGGRQSLSIINRGNS